MWTADVLKFSQRLNHFEKQLNVSLTYQKIQIFSQNEVFVPMFIENNDFKTSKTTKLNSLNKFD